MTGIEAVAISMFSQLPLSMMICLLGHERETTSCHHCRKRCEIFRVLEIIDSGGFKFQISQGLRIESLSRKSQQPRRFDALLAIPPQSHNFGNELKELRNSSK